MWFSRNISTDIDLKMAFLRMHQWLLPVIEKFNWYSFLTFKKYCNAVWDCIVLNDGIE